MKKAYISCRAYKELKDWLTCEGYSNVELTEGERPYPAISSHPDIYICDIGKRLMMQDIVSYNYPEYLAYNGVFLDRYFIHNLKYTSPVLLKEAEYMGLELVNVNQGYTKCSCVVVDGRSIITADEGIANKLLDIDIDVLKIETGHVLLDGFDYGFIGGASGRVGDRIVFNGDLNTHPNHEMIREFILNKGLEIIDFKGLELYDIGTIFVEK